jgi:hypothetical protein
MTEPADLDRRWKGFRPSLAILAVVGLTTGLVAMPAYVTGKRSEDDRQLLKNYRVPDWGETFTHCTMEYVVNSPEYNDVVFLGDSTCVVACKPRQFESATRLTAYNLGAAGFLGIDAYIMILRLYLEHHPPPKLLAFCIHPKAFGSTASQSNWPELRDRFFWCYGSGAEETRPRHDQPFYYVQEGIRVYYGRLWGGVEHFSNVPNPSYGGMSYNAGKREVVEQRGFFAKARALRLAPDAGSLSGKEYSSFRVSPDCDEHLHDLARLTQKYGIVLMIRPTPVLAGTASGRADELDASLRSLKQAFPHVVVCTPEVLLYPPPLFGEEFHCNSDGAGKFTSLLADEAKAALAQR